MKKVLSIVLPHILTQLLALIVTIKIIFIFILCKIYAPGGYLIPVFFVIYNFPVLWSIILFLEKRGERNNLSSISVGIQIVTTGTLAAFLVQVTELVVHSLIVSYPLKYYLVLEAGLNSLWITPVLIVGEVVRNRKKIMKKNEASYG